MGWGASAGRTRSLKAAWSCSAHSVSSEAPAAPVPEAPPALDTDAAERIQTLRSGIEKALQEAREIAGIYQEDADFRETVNRYIHDFEAMLRSVLSTRSSTSFCTAFNASGQPAASVPLHWYWLRVLKSAPGSSVAAVMSP